jgi:flavin-dependent dehydrogenase
MRCDALVIGGGPAGAAAALLLSRSGRSVILLEKARFPRRKVCGEFIAASGIEQLERLGLGERFAASAGPEVRRVALWAGGCAIEAALPAPYARALERETLDTLLLDEARRCGANVLQPMTALSVNRVGNNFICHAAERRGAPAIEIEARAVVAAHGSWEPPGDLLGFQAHFRAADLPPATIALVPFPGGYGGLVERSAGRATFASCVRREALERMRPAGLPAGEALLNYAMSESTSLRRALGHARREGPWLAAGPLRPGRRPLYRAGIFAVGNAAGEAHPVVGEGIAMALGSAGLLCELLAPALAAGYSPETEMKVARLYARRWRRSFVLRLWASALLAHLAMRPSAPDWAEALGRAPGLLTAAARLSGK